jgi:hypothetical protein
MVEMAGIGELTIAHMFCEKLNAKNMLDGSFFVSQASKKTSNMHLLSFIRSHSVIEFGNRNYGHVNLAKMDSVGMV